jgi:hypothetical protein
LETEEKDFAYYALPGAADAASATAVLPPVAGRGFYRWETQGADRWIWSRGDASFLLRYQGDAPRRFRFEGELATRAERSAAFYVNGERLNQMPLQPDIWRSFSVRLTLHPGDTELALTTDRPASRASELDPRDIAFAVRNPRLVAEESKP